MQHGDNTGVNSEKELKLELQYEIIEEFISQHDCKPIEFCNDLIGCLQECLTKAKQHMTLEQHEEFINSLSDETMTCIIVAGDIKIAICEEENYFEKPNCYD